MSLLWLDAARRNIKGGPDGEKPSGAMVAIVPPRDVAEKLLVDDGEAVENMHVTLAYLPYDENKNLDRIFQSIRGFAKHQKALHGKVGGVGTFVNPDSHVLWAAVNIPGLETMQQSVVGHLEAEGFSVASNHGFTPHLTLKYHNKPFRFMPKVDNHEFPVTEIWACVGPQWRSYQLLSSGD